MGKVEELGMENSCSRFRIIHIDSEIIVKKTCSKDLDTEKWTFRFFSTLHCIFSLSFLPFLCFTSRSSSEDRESLRPETDTLNRVKVIRQLRYVACTKAISLARRNSRAPARRGLEKIIFIRRYNEVENDSLFFSLSFSLSLSHSFPLGPPSFPAFEEVTLRMQINFPDEAHPECSWYTGICLLYCLGSKAAIPQVSGIVAPLWREKREECGRNEREGEG